VSATLIRNGRIITASDDHVADLWCSSAEL